MLEPAKLRRGGWRGGKGRRDKKRSDGSRAEGEDGKKRIIICKDVYIITSNRVYYNYVCMCMHMTADYIKYISLCIK